MKGAVYPVAMPGLGEASCLGMGCASLGSRVSERDGLAALERAHAAGIHWYDVAPAYGGGEAEDILGRFLKGRRAGLMICTKVGLMPPKSSGVKRALRGTLRPVVGVLGPLRAMIRKSGATANRAVELTPDLLRGSLDRSLTRLGTEQVDVYALHNARAEDLARDEIRATCAALLAEGKARVIAVAGDTDAARAAIAIGAPFGLVQFAQPAGDDPAMDLFAAAHAAGIGVVTHSVFGVSGSLQALTRRLKGDPALATRLAEAGYAGPPDAAAARLLLARARAANARGVVLSSMFSERSLAANLAGAAAPPDPAALALCAELGV
ncbi:MAG: aldo/keto reductase [Qingshengfaniella sp.]